LIEEGPRCTSALTSGDGEHELWSRDDSLRAATGVGGALGALAIGDGGGRPLRGDDACGCMWRDRGENEARMRGNPGALRKFIEAPGWEGWLVGTTRTYGVNVVASGAGVKRGHNNVCPATLVETSAGILISARCSERFRASGIGRGGGTVGERRRGARWPTSERDV